MTRIRSLAMLAALSMLLVVVPGPTARAEDEKDAGSPNAPAAGFRFSDLDARGQKELAEAARDYFNPDVEFIYKYRKAFKRKLESLASRGVEALKDTAFLRDVVYQGRHFLPRFTDKKWSRSVGATVKKTAGLYQNLESEKLRFTFTEPKGYPAEGKLDKKIPRPAPNPLLITLHEKNDQYDRRGKRAKFVGEVVMKRRFPKGGFGDLYENWFTLAPVAPRALFVEDGRLSHKFFTLPLREFWRRYHVDFDRIVLDGTEAAAYAAASFPYAFAGLVLRGGELDPAVIGNISHLPLYVVKDKDLAKALKAAGHPDVMLGDEKGLWAWIQKRERNVPSSFDWNVYGEDAIRANWINVRTPEFSAEPKFTVTVVDTDQEPNTIKIDAQGIDEIDLFLNDDLVDLDREVRLVLNGEERFPGAPTVSTAEGAAAGALKPGDVILAVMQRGARKEITALDDLLGLTPFDYVQIERGGQRVDVELAAATREAARKLLDGIQVERLVRRDFNRLWDRDPNIRQNMYFGWIYPVKLDGVVLPAPKATEEPTTPETAEVVEGTPEAEAKAKLFWGKAIEAEADGDLGKAKKLYALVVAEGPTTLKARAEAKIAELDGK